MVDKLKVEELFTTLVFPEGYDLHHDFDTYIKDCALEIADVIKNPAEVTVLFRKLQEVRLIYQQALKMQIQEQSYRSVFD